jgi:hypothetical protein
MRGLAFLGLLGAVFIRFEILQRLLNGEEFFSDPLDLIYLLVQPFSSFRSSTHRD